MSQLEHSREPSQQAIALGRAWMAACEEDPEVPERSDQFNKIQDMVDECLEKGDASLDDLMSQAFSWIASQEQGDTSIRFIHALLPHFESITQEDGQTAQAAYLVALPVIGEQEHATYLAHHAGEMAFGQDLVAAGIIPPDSQVVWLPRTVSLQEAGQWMADHRRALLVAGLNDMPLGHAIAPPVEKFGIDRAQLSMLIGVVISPEGAIDAAMADPAFLYASADDFLDEQKPGEDPTEWAIGRRGSALGHASDKMSIKVAELGLEGTVIEEPGTITEALSTLVSWSLRLQQLEEAQVLGMSEEDLDAALDRTVLQVALEVSSGQVSMAVDIDGHVMGPFSTDLPWKSLPVTMVGEGLLKRSIAASPHAINWHATQQQMWSAASGQRRWRMH